MKNKKIKQPYKGGGERLLLISKLAYLLPLVNIYPLSLFTSNSNRIWLDSQFLVKAYHLSKDFALILVWISINLARNGGNQTKAQITEIYFVVNGLYENNPPLAFLLANKPFLSPDFL